jgi:hypothetical protein
VSEVTRPYAVNLKGQGAPVPPAFFGDEKRYRTLSGLSEYRQRGKRTVIFPIIFSVDKHTRLAHTKRT